ncbi:MAG: efflux RND transporter periplasmic adaptor subunit [Candidatus Eisenbacteria bacterium]
MTSSDSARERLRAARRRVFAASAVSLLLFAPGCGKGDEARAGGEATPGGRGNGGRPGTAAVTVATRPAGRGTIGSYYTANATLDPNKEAEVLARVSGVVLELLCEEGDRVAKGAALLRIDDAEYRHRQSQANAAAAKERARFDRLQNMFREEFISADEFEASRADLQSAVATEELAALELSYTRVRAPFAGRITRRHVDPGVMVSDGTPLFSIADVDRLLARVHVPAKEFRNIKTDQTVKLTVDTSEKALSGRIILVSPIIDPNSGTIKVTVEITDYPDNIRPGDFAEVHIVTDIREDAVLVPKSAVVSDRNEQVVFVAADSVAERRIVSVGFQDDVNAEILSGIEGGEPVVVQGQRSLRDGQNIKILDPLSFEPSDKP